MAICPNALYRSIIKDVSPNLSVDQEIAAYLRCTIPSYPDESLQQFASRHLLQNFMKKFISGVAPDADEVALSKFRESNRLCELWALSDERSLRDDILWGTLKRIIHDVFSDDLICFDDLTSLSPEGDEGPGSSATDSSTDLYTKLYGQGLSSSSDTLIDLFYRWAGSIPRWKEALLIRQLHFGVSPVVSDSSLSFVPKDETVTRSICAEPTINMWYQQAYRFRLEKVLLRRFGIDLSTQPDVNRTLARTGSMYRNFATIDLKSASDSISLKFLEAVLPKQVYSVLKILRSPRTRAPTGEIIDLNMVSTMGNAFTFPLQTMLFACVIQAVYEVYDIPFLRNLVSTSSYTGWDPPVPCKTVRPGNFAVFGDDLIVVNSSFAAVCHLLNMAGFRVNESKSFSLGSFRESCGSDFLSGHNVRPVFLKDVKHVYSRFSTLNLLRYWSARNSIPLPNSCKLLLWSVPFLPVPRAEGIEVGIHVPFSVITPKQDDNRSFLYKRLRPRPLLAKVVGECIESPVYAKKIFNPSGLVLFALSGGLRDGSFALRPRIARYCLGSTVSPNWDTLPWGLDLLDPVGWCRWESDTIRLLQKSGRALS